MAGSLIDDRIIFQRGAQRKFLIAVRNKLAISWSQMAQMANVSGRTLRDWRDEKLNMSARAGKLFTRASGISPPASILKKTWHEHLEEIAGQGGKELMKKYGVIGGDADYRRRKWQEWWNTFGKKKKITILQRKNIQTPPKSPFLAEFVGIMIGDGGIAPYHISITLNRVTDWEYAQFVSQLIYDLFGTYPKMYSRKDSLALTLVVARKDLVDFCISLGLKSGNKLKEGLDIPRWIQLKKEFAIACIRGLVDTDGSVYQHHYKVANKKYSYTKISFTSRSLSLIRSTQRLFLKLGLKPSTRKDLTELKLENQMEVRKYREIIGSNNPKHLKKYDCGL